MAEKLTNEELNAVYGIVMRNEASRGVLRRLLASTGFFGGEFNENPYNTAYYAGRRSVGVELFEEMKRRDPEMLTVLLKEHIKNG